MSQATSSPNFSLAQARRIVGDLFVPNPVIYWADFLATFTVGMVCFRLVRTQPLFSPAQLVLFVTSALMFYRAALFTHELVHIRSGEFRVFRVVWNLLCGVPFLIPTFTYYTHIDHHRRKHFGTRHDGEYLPLGASPPRELLFYMAQVFVLPILAVVRFGLLTPLTWFSPKLRELVHQHASSMVADPRYIRPLPTRQALRLIRLQELACFLFLVVLGIMLYRQRLIPNRWFFLGQAYCMSMFVLTVNTIRTLGAHRYTNTGGEMTFLGQLLDSVNYSARSWLAFLWAPLGLRFHALHHLFPSLPYHALGEAHCRLMKELPADSPYRQTEADSLFVVLGQLARNAIASGRRHADQTQQPSQLNQAA